MARRAAQVARVAWRHLLLPRLRKARAPSRAERMQAALEELGGTWIKLGQALALRFDLLPADYCLQFFRLLNQVEPFSPSLVRAALEQELGQPVEMLFRRFEWTPLAAASIGQVHRAELPDGTRVAVKVQRPGIAALVRADLRLMRWLAALIDLLPLFGHTRARDLVREFAGWTEDELDYRKEARHAAVLRENAQGDPNEYNPQVFSAYTTERVLTLEYLNGISVIEIVTAIRRRDAPFLDALAARGHDTRRIASRIVWNGLNQIYRFGYFHADPHPANLIVLDGDAIGYVDFGIVGKLDRETTDSLRDFAQNLFSGRIGRAVDEFMRFLSPSARTDLTAARRDLIEAMRNYLESARVVPDGLSSPQDIFEIEMLAIVRRHSLALEPDAARYLKAVLTTEAMVKELDPEFDLQAHENRFFSRLMQLELSESLHVGRVGQWLLDARFQLRRLFESIEETRQPAPQPVAVAQRVRRRVQVLSILSLLGWIAVLVTAWSGATPIGSPGVGTSFRWMIFGGAAISLVLSVCSILQVRRLPANRAYGHTRRLR